MFFLLISFFVFEFLQEYLFRFFLLKTSTSFDICFVSTFFSFSLFCNSWFLFLSTCFLAFVLLRSFFQLFYFSYVCIIFVVLLNSFLHSYNWMKLLQAFTVFILKMCESHFDNFCVLTWFFFTNHENQDQFAKNFPSNYLIENDMYQYIFKYFFKFFYLLIKSI